MKEGKFEPLATDFGETESKVSGEEHSPGFIDKLKRIFSGLSYKKELPPASFEIFYSRHMLEEDLRGIEEKMAVADVFILESAGWSRSSLKSKNKVAKRKITPEEFLNEYDITPETDLEYGFSKRIYSLVYKYQTPVIHIDIPSGHPLLHRDRKNFFKIKLIDNFSENINGYKAYLKEFSDIQKEREEYMLSQLGPSLVKIFRANPQWKEKEKLNVLLFLGAFHTSISHRIKQSGKEVKRTFPYKPYIYNFQGETQRRHIFNKESSDDLAARALFEILLRSTGIFDRLSTQFPSKVINFQRKTNLMFTFDEIKNFFDKIRTELKDRHKYDTVLKIIKERLDAKGIKIPESEEELDLFLSNKL